LIPAINASLFNAVISGEPRHPEPWPGTSSKLSSKLEGVAVGHFAGEARRPQL